MKKELFADEKKKYKIKIINSHHGHRAVIMTKKYARTNAEQTISSKVTDTQKGGNSRRK